MAAGGVGRGALVGTMVGTGGVGLGLGAGGIGVVDGWIGVLVGITVGAIGVFVGMAVGWPDTEVTVGIDVGAGCGNRVGSLVGGGAVVGEDEGAATGGDVETGTTVCKGELGFRRAGSLGAAVGVNKLDVFDVGIVATGAVRLGNSAAVRVGTIEVGDTLALGSKSG